jgi:hypothetical protein
MNWIPFALCSALLTAHGLGQTPARRFPLAERDVMLAMQQRGLPLEGLQLRPAAAITSSVASPDLDIRSLTPSGRRTAQLVVACRNSSECLPFYVSAAWSADVNTAEMHARFDPPTASARKATAAASKTAAEEETQALRPGSPALLLLEGERVHVRMRVVCVEAGDPGASVRVTTPDRKQAYQAEVIGPGVVKGSF